MTISKILRLSLLSSCTIALVYADLPVLSYTVVEDATQHPILTPTLKDRKTAKITLANGLQAYLISDPNIDQSAASMSVEVGSWQDPAEYPGMAHFLEHMLFMGNKAYPDEAEYSQYIQDNEGSQNAFTAPDRTVYMFSVNNHAFAGALDRFSHFFIDPLFNPSCISRELQAVDQENSKNLEHDGWREHMVLKETGNPDHPNRKFSTGNAATLGGIPQDALKEWYSSHYSANKMHLILLSNLPLDQMIELTVSDFSSIPTVDVIQEISASSPLLSEGQKGHFIHIKPIKDLRNLTLVWDLPTNLSSVDAKWTAEIISYALEQASHQSLIQELKKEGLAENLSAGLDRFGKETALFQINVSLTEKGLSQIDTVILRCYQALARLKQTGLSIALFQERQTMAQINYQYQSRQEPFQWIYKVAYDIIDEHLSTFPEKTLIPEEFDPESLLQFLKVLTPESCAYFVVADPEKFEIEEFTTEKWYGVQYAMQSILPSKLAAWQTAPPHSDIQAPPLNPYIPSLPFTLVSSGSSEKNPLIPKLLSENDKGKIYFATDTSYLVPEAALVFHLRSPLLDGTPLSFSLMDLFSKSLREELSSELFFADSAGLSAGFGYKAMQFSLQVLGYSEKAPDLMETLISGMKKINISKKNFDTYKASLVSAYTNATHELPVKQAIEKLSDTLLNDAPTPQEKLRALQGLTYEEFSAFSKELLSQVYLEGLIYGNLTEEQGTALVDRLQSELRTFQPYPLKEQKRQEMLLLPQKGGPFKIIQKTDRQGYATMLAVQEGAFSFAKKASQQVLSKVLHEAFFHELRTQQQTGYIAQSKPSEIENQLMHVFAVQSSSYTPEDLLFRFEVFLSDFTKRIEEIIPEDRFNHLKDVQITTLEMPPENLEAMAQRLDALAFEYKGDFKRLQKRIDTLKELSYKTFIQDVETFLSSNNSQRLAILIQGKAAGEKPLHYQEVTRKDLEEIGSFTSSFEK